MKEQCNDETRGRCRKTARWIVDGYRLCDEHADEWIARLGGKLSKRAI